MHTLTLMLHNFAADTYGSVNSMLSRMGTGTTHLSRISLASSTATTPTEGSGNPHRAVGTVPAPYSTTPGNTLITFRPSDDESDGDDRRQHFPSVGSLPQLRTTNRYPNIHDRKSAKHRPMQQRNGKLRVPEAVPLMAQGRVIHEDEEHYGVSDIEFSDRSPSLSRTSKKKDMTNRSLSELL